jgi:hypothetical protein
MTRANWLPGMFLIGPGLGGGVVVYGFWGWQSLFVVKAAIGCLVVVILGLVVLVRGKLR